METLRILAVNPYMLVLLLPRKYNFEGCFGSKPDILSLWTGDDVLGLCSKGGDSTDEITSTAQFNTDFNKVVTDMTANGAKGVIANILTL
jgi:hypothetical protein